MKKTITAVILACLIMMTSCAAENKENAQYGISDQKLSSEPSVRDLFAMDTFMTLKAYGENSDEALGKAAEAILMLEKKLSVTDEESDIWAVNHSGGKSTEISTQTAEIIDYALGISELTDGALDISVYPVLREWGFTTDSPAVPEQIVIDEQLKKVDYGKIVLNDGTVCLPEYMQIDLGAAAKGYTSDLVTDILREYGIGSAVISLGGNVQTVGAKPDGSSWKIAVRDPFDENGAQTGVLSVKDKAVITSGDYERYFIGEDGKKYFHIIDPSDGYPADNGLVSVTIVSNSGLMCDCLSTAVFVMGMEKACDYWRNNKGFEMILINDSGEVYVTEGIAEDYQDSSGKGFSVISD